MPMIKDEEICGYYVDQECVCRECITRQEKEQLTPNSFILDSDLENEDWYFCDRCEEMITQLQTRLKCNLGMVWQGEVRDIFS